MTTLLEAFGSIGGQQHYAVIVEAIRNEYLGTSGLNKHRERRKEFAARLALYRDDVANEIRALIDQLYRNQLVKEDRERLVGMIGFHNVWKRITDTVACLYNTPAKRRPDPARADEFTALERELSLHSTMKEAHRLTFALNNVLLWSVTTAKRSLRIVTPDRFDVVPNPRDALDLVAVIIDAAPAWVPSTIVNVSAIKHYELWDSEVRIDLDATGKMIGDPVEHKLGRIPGVLTSSRIPVDRLIEDRAGRDIQHAARAMLFLNLVTLSLSLDASERQPVLKGNLAEMAANQPKTAGIPLALPPGVTAEMLDMVTDPEHVLKVCKHVLSSVAQTYGMSYEQLTLEDTSTGKAYAARREKLTELRSEQRERALVTERDVMDLVGFTGAQNPDFHEIEVPTDPIEELDVLDRRINRGLDNPIAYIMRKDPDLSIEDATLRFLGNVTVNGWLYTLLRMANLSLTAPASDPGRTPQDNGALSQTGPAPEHVDPAPIAVAA